MTVIIWLKHEWQNYIAADCRVVAWHNLTSDNVDKIHNHNNCLIWFAWWIAECWVFKKILSENKDIKINNEGDILDFYLKLRQIMKEHSMLDTWEYPSIAAIFITEKNIYELWAEGSVVIHKDKCCIGSWDEIATWILDWYKITSPEKDLKEIIKKVSKYSLGVSPNSIVKMPLSSKVIKAIRKVSKPKA